jgi:hypothetical protein
MTYLEAKSARDAIDADVIRLSAILQNFPKGRMGSTPETVKASSEYRSTKLAYDQAFQRLRAFNTLFVRHFASEIRATRRNRFA